MTILNLNISYPDFQLGDVIDPQSFDLNNSEIVTKINEIKNVVNTLTDGTTGASNISLATIAPFASTKVQAFLQEMVDRLKATAAGVSGADFVGTPAITGVTGVTVGAQLSSFKSLLDVVSANVAAGVTALNTHKTSADHDGRYYTESELNAGQLDNRYYTETEINSSLALKADAATTYTRAALDAGQLDTRYFTEAELTAGQLDSRYYTQNQLSTGQLDTRYYTEPEIDTKLTNLQAGQIVTNSITNAQLATDVKVGSLSLLTTTNKSDVTGAINEVKTASDSASTAAGTAQTTANAALPKAGGAMTSAISFPNNSTLISAAGGGSLTTGSAGGTISAKAGTATSSSFSAIDNTGVAVFTAGSNTTPSVTTKNNTLDDGTGKMTLAGELMASGNKGVTANNYANLSSCSSGDVLIGNNCYLDIATSQLKYKITHGSLGARGMLIRWSTDGQIYYFNTGNIASTADATFVPTFHRMWNANNDGVGSGLDADTVSGLTLAGIARTNGKFTPAQLQNTQLASGIYTNDGQGLLKSDGVTPFKSGYWYHIYHSYHGADGYAVQVAYPYGHMVDQTVYWRSSSGFTWGEWQTMGGNSLLVPSDTIQQSVDTEVKKTWAEAGSDQNNKIIVAKFVVKSLGEVKLKYELKNTNSGTGTYGFASFATGTNTSSQAAVPGMPYNYTLPVGTLVANIANGQFGMTTLPVYAQTPTYIAKETFITIHEPTILYVFFSVNFNSGTGGSDWSYIRNVRLCYDTI